MNTSIKIVTISLAALSAMQAATVNVISRNGETPTLSRIIVNSSGTALGSGYAAIGYFNSITPANFATSTGLQLQSDFSILGTATTDLTFDGFPGSPFPGIIEFSASANDPTNAFTGKSAYLVIGNGATLATSTEAFIYLTSLAFGDDLAPPVALDLSVANPVGNVQFGSESANGTMTIGSAFSQQVSNAFQTSPLAAIPEPSALLLSALGALALLRRKR